MSREDERAVDLLRPLRLIEPRATGRVEADDMQRKRVVVALSELALESLRSHRKKRSTRAVLLGAAAMAAGLLGWFVRDLWPQNNASPPTVHSSVQLAAVSGQVTVHRKSGGNGPGEVGRSLDAQDGITTERFGTASLVLPNGAKVHVEGASQVEIGNCALSDSSETLKLKRGTLKLTVPKLAPGQHLAIATPSASVSVVGTRFWVSVVPKIADRDERTCVGVSEGRVRITTSRTQQLLTAGGHWSSDGRSCSEQSGAPRESGDIASDQVEPSLLQRQARPQPGRSAEPDPRPTVPADNPGTANGSVPPGLRRQVEPVLQKPKDPPMMSADGHAPPTVAFEESSLEDENQLFAAAVAARRASRPEQAVKLLTSLLRRYPNSPLTQDALREFDRARNELRVVPGTAP